MLAVLSLGGVARGNAQTAAAQIVAPAQAGVRVLFIRSGVGRGGFFECGSTLGANNACKDEQSSSLSNNATNNGNHGWYELAQVLEGEGFTLEELREGPWDDPEPVPLAAMDLSVYSVIVFGSNNDLGYTAADIDALERFVRRGGGALFISDANFGWNWGAAPSSDQLFLNRFGMVMNQDQGTYNSTRTADFTAAGQTHPILSGINAFGGEGVSPITVASSIPAGVTVTVLARAEGMVRRNNHPTQGQGSSTAATSEDGTLVIARSGMGRVAGHFDRNTFFNVNGAGASIRLIDNRAYAIRLFRWLAYGDTLAPVSAYWLWTEGAFPAGYADAAKQPAANPDADLERNIEEYYQLSNPLAAGVGGPLFGLNESGGTEYAELEYRRNLAADDVTMEFQGSGDLVNWDPATPVSIEELSNDGLLAVYRARFALEPAPAFWRMALRHTP